MDEVGRLTRAAGVVGSLTLLSRITGLLRDMVVGYLFGAQGAADAFFVAFRIPNLLRRLTAEGALTTAFVPVFTDYLVHHGKTEAIRVGRIIFTLAALIVGGITVLGIIFAIPVTHLFAPGFLATAGKFDLTVSLTQVMFPYIFFVSLVALAMGVLNSFHHFMAPAFSPVLLNLAIIAGALFLAPFLTEPVIALGYGVLLGGVAQLLLQLPYLARHGFFYAPDFHFRHPAVKRLVVLLLPGVFGAAIYQINVLVSTIFASMLPEGSVSYLYYADRLLQFPLGIFAVALGTAALPSFSSLVAKEEFTELGKGLSYSLRLINFITLPATLGLMVTSVPLFSILFQRGAFDPSTTRGTAEALWYFSLGLWGASGTRLVVPVFYAMKETITPVLIGFLSFILNLLLSLALMGGVCTAEDSNVLTDAIYHLSRSLGVVSLSYGGLALATSITSTFNFLVLLLILQRRLGLPLDGFFASFFWSFLNSLLMALPLFLVVGSFDWIASEAFWLRGSLLVLVLGMGVLLYLALSFLLRSPDWPAIRDLALRILKRRW